MEPSSACPLVTSSHSAKGLPCSTTQQAYVNMEQQINAMLREVGSLLGDLAGGDAAALDDTMTHMDMSLSRFWGSFHALKKRQSDGLNVAVLALAKSGKSTLLNALTGYSLLPMNNVPETARLVKLVHMHAPAAAAASSAAAAAAPADSQQQPYLEEPLPGAPARTSSNASGSGAAAVTLQVTARGEAEVCARLQELNQLARSSPLGRSLSPRASVELLGRSGSFSSGAPGQTPSSSFTRADSAAPALAGAAAAGVWASSSSGFGAGGAGGASSSSSSPFQQAVVPLSPWAAATAGGAGGAAASAAAAEVDRMLVLHAPIAALQELEGCRAEGGSAGAGSGAVRLALLDTPGPNEAGEEQLRFQVERLLDGVDAALYLLDYTKLKTQDEATLFTRLKAVNPALVQRLSQRLFFVVNKVDAALVSEGLDPDATRAYVADLVTRQLECEGFRLEPDQVLLVSARNALLARLVLSGRASEDARKRFVQLAFGRFASPSTVGPDRLREAAEAVLMDSGVLQLEEQVLSYLYTHAGAVKQLALLDDVARLLQEVRNVAVSCRACLVRGVEEVEGRLVQLRAQINGALSAFDDVMRDADAVAGEVTAEVRAHLRALHGKLLSHIITTLDPTGPPAAAGAAASGPGGGSGRRWGRVRDRFLSLFTSVRTASTAAGAEAAAAAAAASAAATARPSAAAGGIGSGAAGAFHVLGSSAAGTCTVSYAMGSGPGGSGTDPSGTGAAAVAAAAAASVARSRSRDELLKLLVELHEELLAQINSEVSEFWGQLEASASARHAELINRLNRHLATLSRLVESAVSHSLSIHLTPVALRLPVPSADAFHSNLDALLHRGVVEAQEKHLRVGQRQYEEKVLRQYRQGLCRWGRYWESVPRVRTVVETYAVTVYELLPAEITRHFISLVDSAVESTEAATASHVSAFVQQQVDAAKGRVLEYSDSYLTAMSSALDAGRRGADSRAAALRGVEGVVGRVEGLMQHITSLQAEVELDVPPPPAPQGDVHASDADDGEYAFGNDVEEEEWGYGGGVAGALELQPDAAAYAQHAAGADMHRDHGNDHCSVLGLHHGSGGVNLATEAKQHADHIDLLGDEVPVPAPTVPGGITEDASVAAVPDQAVACSRGVAACSDAAAEPRRSSRGFAGLDAALYAPEPSPSAAPAATPAALAAAPSAAAAAPWYAAHVDGPQSVAVAAAAAASVAVPVEAAPTPAVASLALAAAEGHLHQANAAAPAALEAAEPAASDPAAAAAAAAIQAAVSTGIRQQPLPPLPLQPYQQEAEEPEVVMPQPCSAATAVVHSTHGNDASMLSMQSDAASHVAAPAANPPAASAAAAGEAAADAVATAAVAAAEEAEIADAAPAATEPETADAAAAKLEPESMPPAPAAAGAEAGAEPAAVVVAAAAGALDSPRRDDAEAAAREMQQLQPAESMSTMFQDDGAQFDYATGFARAMSTSQLLQQQQPAGGTAGTGSTASGADGGDDTAAGVPGAPPSSSAVAPPVAAAATTGLGAGEPSDEWMLVEVGDNDA